MYTRSYLNDSSAMPPSYDGVAMREPASAPPPPPPEPMRADECARPPQERERGGFLDDIFRTLHIGLPRTVNFGYEEMLIIAVAALMFFSDGGDKECAIMLLLLLLIN